MVRTVDFFELFTVPKPAIDIVTFAFLVNKDFWNFEFYFGHAQPSLNYTSPKGSELLAAKLLRVSFFTFYRIFSTFILIVQIINLHSFPQLLNHP